MPSEFFVKIEEGKTANVKVLHVDGELDEISIEKLKDQVNPLLEDAGLTKLVFDLAGLDFINSKGIGYLVSVHTHLTKDARVMVMTSAKKPVMDVLTLVGLTSIMPYYATLQEALS